MILVIDFERIVSPAFCTKCEFQSSFVSFTFLDHPEDPALMEFEMPPYVCLRVRGLAALKPPAKNGPMLAHCGGPGSGRDCAQSAFNSAWFSMFQRII